ncbi:mucin-5AC-like [Drosophila serrata]|uniref:mucin-5AC-like n=1 Tax=Drosophila serrata TaxID=7274 RepID=UPI000A1CFEBE|nr:mucin-5AC-like [Drosophila serrata]
MQLILTVSLIVAFGNLAFVSAQKCQECQTNNDVYCHNQTTYQNCMKGKPIGDVEQCPEGTVCTNDLDVCVEKPDGTNIMDVCGSNSACGSCDGSPKYTCVSSTQFARCKGTTLITSTIYSCEEDEVCYQKGLDDYETVCVPSCALNYLDAQPTCTNDDFTTTTTTAAPPTTPSDADRQNICEAAASGTTASPTSTLSTESPTTGTSSTTSATTTAVTKFFYTRNTGDKTCTTYLYCQKSPTGTEWTTVFLTCSAPKPYFDSTTKNCVATKPTDC